MLKNDCVILFQGDSITDVGRTEGMNGDMGWGYPNFVKEIVDTAFADKNITVINRGICGNRCKDLVARWDEDCILLKPDIISILIGVNDTWRAFDENDPTSKEYFEESYRNIIERAKAQTDAEIILFNPYIIKGCIGKHTAMRKDLAEKQEVVKKLAAEYGLKLIDLDKLFTDMLDSGTKPKALSLDGIHPTDYGHRIIAQEWLKAQK